MSPLDWRNFVASNQFTASTVQSFCNSIGIAPGIVAGRLQHAGHLEWSKLNLLKLRIALKIDSIASPPDNNPESILDMFERLRKSVPPNMWEEFPADWAKNKKHYLYGFPKEAD